MAAKKDSLLSPLRDPAKRGRLIWLALTALLTAMTARWTGYALGHPFWRAHWSRTAWPAQLSFPISTVEHPLLAVVLGTALAVLLASPLVAAARSRARGGVVLALGVMVLGPLPFVVSMPGTQSWPQMLRGMAMLLICMALLGLWVTGPLVIVRRRVQRTPPLVRSAIGHMGYVAYFVCVSVTSPGILYHLPWMLGVALSWLLVAAVLHVKDWSGLAYRWLSPAAGLVLLGASVLLFHAGVGADERELPLLQAWCDPPALFPRGPLRGVDAKSLARALGGRGRSDPEAAGLAAIEATLAARASLLEAPRSDALPQIDDFLAAFPRSRHRASALALKGRILDTRLHMDLFKHQQLCFYEDFPAEESWPTWHQLAAEHAGTPWAFLAQVRLAQLTARSGRWLDALRCLPAEGTPPPTDGLLAAERALLEEAWIHALALRQLINQNRDDPTYGHEPLAAFVQMDPREWDAAAQLEAASSRPVAGGLLTDNIALLRARLEAERDRYAALRRIAAREEAALEQADEAAQPALRRQFQADRVRAHQTADRREREALEQIVTGEATRDTDAACEALLLLARRHDRPGAPAQLLSRAAALYQEMLRRFGDLPLSRYARHRLERLSARPARGPDSRPAFQPDS